MIGKKIKSLIEESGLKYADISQQLGISYQNLNRILNKESVETRYLFEIAKILNIPVISFFEDEPGGKMPYFDVDKILKENEKLKEMIEEKDHKISDLKFTASYIKSYYEYNIRLSQLRSDHMLDKDANKSEKETDSEIYSDPLLIRLQKVKDEYSNKMAFGKIDFDLSQILE